MTARIDNARMARIQTALSALYTQIGRTAMPVLGRVIDMHPQYLHDVRKGKRHCGELTASKIEGGLEKVNAPDFVFAGTKPGRPVGRKPEPTSNRDLSDLRTRINELRVTEKAIDSVLAKKIGCHHSLIYQFRTGRCSLGKTSEGRLREALATMSYSDKKYDTAERRRAVSRGGTANRELMERLAAEQADLRGRLKSAFAARGVTIKKGAALAGISNATASRFFNGGAMRPLQVAKVEKWLNGRGAPAQLALPMQQTDADRVAVVTARLSDLAGPEVDTVDVKQITDAFLRKTGLEAIQALLRIAKSINLKGE